MHVVINRKELIEHLSVLEMALPGRVSFAPVEGVYMSREGDSLTLCANDLEMAIRLSTGDVKGEGEGATVLPKKFVQIVKQLPGNDVGITVEKNRAEIVSGSSKFKLNCIDAEEFPIFSDSYTESPSFEVEGRAIKEMIRKVAFCVSADIGKPMFMGVYITNENGVLSCMASDTYRLAWYKNLKVNYHEPFSLIVPGELLTKIGKIINDDDNVKIYIGERELVLAIGGYVVSTRLLDGKYPDLSNVLPEKPETQTAIERQPLIDTINRAILVVDKGTKTVSLAVNDCITVNAESELGRMNEELPISFKGNLLEGIFINARYLLEGIKAVDGDTLHIDFHRETGPIIVKEAGFRYLVLPIKAH